jgi:gamma-tubulin complex component 3
MSGRAAAAQDQDDPSPPAASGGVSSEFPVLQERLKQLGTNFRTRLQFLLGDLAYQPDVDMRFLGVAMNFNEVYQPMRRRSRQPAAAAGAASNPVRS